jgi:hypothetical protein
VSVNLATFLDPYDPDQVCPKCDHDQVRTTYRPDSSHYRCGVAQRLGTSHAGEHLERRCERCAYTWEQLCVPVPATG